MKRYLILSLSVALCSIQAMALATPTELENVEDVSRFGTSRSLACIQINSGNTALLRIDTPEQYAHLMSHRLPFLQCMSFSLPEIDLSRSTILGFPVSAGGCSIEFSRKLVIDETAKKVIFSAYVKMRGACEKQGQTMNWVIVPKIPADYTIERSVLFSR